MRPTYHYLQRHFLDRRGDYGVSHRIQRWVPSHPDLKEWLHPSGSRLVAAWTGPGDPGVYHERLDHARIVRSNRGRCGRSKEGVYFFYYRIAEEVSRRVLQAKPVQNIT